jgi:uncharacterized protein (DUF58 family)
MNVQCRGAYFGKKESVNIFDALGFFQFSQTVSQNDDIKLLVTPPIIDEIIPVPYRSGGSEHREDFRFIKTDDLIDQRQYVPGDDPRRINWKLYGHVRELFVREGESEPPPKSKLLILIDTSVDETLYTFDAGRSAIDALCSYALAVALESSRCGLEVSIGCNGSEIKSAKEQELASLLSFPYAAAFRESSPLAEPSDNCAIIILALPRESAEMGSLDSFLKKRKPHQPVDIWFVYKNEYESRAAELCARMYNQKGGVYAHCIHAV